MAADTFTTVTDEWDQPAVDDFRRDHNKWPLIMQPDGTRTAYRRCSKAAAEVENTFNLERYDNRNIAYGMAYDSSLVARLIALGGDPSTWDWPTKEKVHKILDDARTTAKAHKAADIGTAVHHLTHRVDRGETVNAGPYQADLDAYQLTMQGHRLEVNRRYIECRIVNDLLRMAGSADRIVTTVVHEGRVTRVVYRIADIKTGASVDFGGLGFAAQLAAYAGGVLYDVTTEQRIDTPPIDLTTGYIIHLPAGQGRCTIHEVDLVGGHRAADLANEIRAIRKESKTWITPKSTWVAAPAVERSAGDAWDTSPAKNSEGAGNLVRVVSSSRSNAEGTDTEASSGSMPAPAEPAPSTSFAAAAVDPPPVAQPAPTPPAGVGATIAASQGRGTSLTGTDDSGILTPLREWVGEPMGADSSASHPNLTPTPIAAPVPMATATRRQALLNRYHRLLEIDQRRFDAKKRSRMVYDEKTASYLFTADQAETLLDEIEATAARSHDPRNALNFIGTSASPTSHTIDEGDTVHPDEIDTLKIAYHHLPPEAKAWVNSLVAEGNAAGVPWNTSNLPSTRRYHLGRAIVAIAGSLLGSRASYDVIRGVLGEATGREEVEQDSLPLGAAIGTCNHIEATRFATLVDNYLDPGNAA